MADENILIGNLGVIGPDIPDSRDYKYSEHLAGASQNSDTEHTIPDKFDDYSLRPYIGKILNQYTTNSCTGHSAMYAMNILLNRINGNVVSDWKINPWWVYYWARKESHLENRDGGAYMRCLMNALCTYGVYSNNMSSPDSKPGEYNLDDSFKVKEYFRINNNLNEVKYALTVEKLPLIASWCVYESAIDRYTGIINSSTSNLQGYHAICLTGVKTIKGKQYIEFANSWGGNWGDYGFGYLDPEILANEYLMTDIYCPTYKYN